MDSTQKKGERIKGSRKGETERREIALYAKVMSDLAWARPNARIE